MPYDKNHVDEAKKKGLFEENVFDSKSLLLDDEEKNKLKNVIIKKSVEENTVVKDEVPEEKQIRNHEKKDINVEINIFEKILIAILTFLGIENLQTYKINKAISQIERYASRLKPPIFNIKTKNITKYFAYSIHDIYLKLFCIKQLYADSVSNSELWNNSEQMNKTGIEILFEGLAGIDSNYVDNRFSQQGIIKVFNDFDNFNAAIEAVNQKVKDYLHSIDKASLGLINSYYTNIIYFKNLIDYDFDQIFKKFDPQFTPSEIPSFIDIVGEAVSPYLASLEEAILQIDLSLDNFYLFKNLEFVSKILSVSSKSYVLLNQEITGIDNSILPGINNFDNELALLLDSLKELLYNNSITCLLQIIRRDPVYSPVFIHTKYDLYKNYCEAFEKRIKNIINNTIKEKKQKQIENTIKKVFNTIKWAGIYNADFSEKIENDGFLDFIYCYHIGMANTFLNLYYDEMVKNVLNIVSMSGVFTEKFFKKNVSDAFYRMEKFEEKFKEFLFEMNPEGIEGKKIIDLLSRKEENRGELKKSLERNIMSVNNKARSF